MADKGKRTTFFSQHRFMGIGDFAKESANFQIPDQYFFSRAIDYRTDPSALTILPGSIKESGSTVTDLLKWGDIVSNPSIRASYFYGDTGNIYKRSNTFSWSLINTAANSHGNGLAYFTADDYLYYTTDNALGRGGLISTGSLTFQDNFLKSQGGVPLNTASLGLVAASTQYAHAADSASLSVTGNLTLETEFKLNSLPAVGSSMTLLGKWDESGATRSYKMDLFGVSGFFGSGSDGNLTISVNTTDAPIDSACSGSAGTQVLTATNTSFAVNQIIFIHQTQGANAGKWERNIIQGYTAGTITLGSPLMGTYGTGAQVIVVKQYGNVTVNTGITWTAKAWNGTVGGILVFLSNGTLSGAGTISSVGCGFRGGAATIHPNETGHTGESYMGLGGYSTSQGQNSPSNYGAGQGGGQYQIGSGGGNGGCYATVGTRAGYGTNSDGTTYGSNDLSTIHLGSGGGGSYKWESDGTPIGTNGAPGGGILFATVVTYSLTGSFSSNGASSSNSSQSYAGGAGSGGSALVKAQTATLGSSLITASGGIGGTGSYAGAYGGNGGNGRIVLDYLTSYTGTTTPTLNAIQDNTLVTTTTIQARLGISNDGTAFEYLTKNLSGLTTGTWQRLSVAWTASTSTAEFYLDAVDLGSNTGTKTSINDNASLLYVGNNKSSVLSNYFDGYLNDMRIWNNVQTAGQIFANNSTQISGSTAGLQAYYKFNSAYTDSTANANTLTAVNTPVFTTDVPFPSPTTRLDIDKVSALTGQTYAIPTAISEAGTDKLPFTPITDPQASIAFYVGAKGTGDWTVTIHDTQNRLIATQTILNANVPTAGIIEFVFASPWRVFLNKSYHAHLTVTTGTSTIITGTSNDISTAEYTTYFGFLVPDTQYHPIVQYQYQPLGGVLTGAMIIGNERYVAVWDGANYLPNFLTFPPQWKVRCFGFWREYLAIGMWRGGNIYDFDKGRVYFWDGIAPTYSFFIDVPEGQINALYGVDSDLYMFAGYRGNMLRYQGGYFYNTGNSESNKLKRMPLIQPSDYTEIYPGALTMWRSILHFGLFGNSNSTVMQRGVYSYGTLNQFYPDTLSYDYVVSTGNKGNTVSIGLVFPVGNDLIVGWRDGIATGADKINFNNPAAASAELQLLTHDSGQLYNDNLQFAVRADFLPLKTGESVDVKINLNRTGFQGTTLQSTVGKRFAKSNVSNSRGSEWQLGCDLFSTNGTSPTLLALSVQKDEVSGEEQF